MSHELYVFGDSHWRNFFPFTNDGAPGVYHEQDGIVTLDTTGNELSGATMWGLMNDDSEIGARRRILETVRDKGGVDNVGLVFGEVDCRFHAWRYFRPDGNLSLGRVYELIGRYKRFIDDDLFSTGLVRGNAFVYFGFRYPLGTETPTTVGMGLGRLGLDRTAGMTRALEALLPAMLRSGRYSDRIHLITPGDAVIPFVGADGVHQLPEHVHREFVHPRLLEVLS